MTDGGYFIWNELYNYCSSISELSNNQLTIKEDICILYMTCKIK